MSNQDCRPELELQEFYPTKSVVEGEFAIGINQPFTVGDLAPQLKAARNEFFLTPTLNEELHLDEYLLQEAHFQEIEAWQIGRENSKSQVFFGELTLIADNPEGTTAVIPVACKPFLSSVADAVHEFTAYEHVNDMGFIETYHPLGFWVDGDGKTFLLSRFEEAVETFDNIDWDRTVEKALKDHFDVFAAIERAAYTLSRFHSRGFTHQDAQVKNMAVDQSTGAVRAVDLETLRLVHTPEEPNLTHMQHHMFRDGKDFIESIFKAGFLLGDSGNSKEQVLHTAFVQPYISSLRHPSTMFERYGPGSTAMIEQVAVDLQALF